MLQSLKIIIWYKKLSFAEKAIMWHKQAYLLLLDRVFSELFERNFNPQFFRCSMTLLALHVAVLAIMKNNLNRMIDSHLA